MKSKKHGFLKSIFPCKGDGVGEAMRKLVLIIAVVVFIVSGSILIKSYFDSHQNKKMYSSLSDTVLENGEKSVVDIEQDYSDIDFPDGIQKQYMPIYALNQDFVGWFSIGDTISLPIVKGSDNDYYLTHSFEKGKSRYGNPFLDFSNSIENFDFNTVIYGHNMKDKQIFGKLIEMYATASAYKNNPLISFNTIYKNQNYVVLGAFYSNAYPSDNNGYVFPFNLTQIAGQEREEFLNELNKRFLYSSNVDVNGSDELLTLSTCSYDYEEERFVVVARKLRANEDESITYGINAQVNKNPLMPQAWYDKRGIDNPFINEPNW